MFSDLKIPFACVATDIVSGQQVVMRTGPVTTAVRPFSLGSPMGAGQPSDYLTSREAAVARKRAPTRRVSCPSSCSTRHTTACTR